MEEAVFSFVNPSYLSLIVASLVLGYALGLIWELFRILRRAFPHRSVWIAVEDLIFFFVASFSYWIVCFSFSFGVPRWFSLFALCGGFVIYLKTLGILLTRLSQRIIRGVLRLLRWGKHRLLIPLGKSFFSLLLLVLFPLRRLFSFWKACHQRNRLRRKLRRFLTLASRGFND